MSVIRKKFCSRSHWLVRCCLVKLWPFKYFALTNVIVTRLARRKTKPHPTMSVIVPGRNEAGNMPRLIEEVPEMGWRNRNCVR